VERTNKIVAGFMTVTSTHSLLLAQLTFESLTRLEMVCAIFQITVSQTQEFLMQLTFL